MQRTNTTPIDNPKSDFNFIAEENHINDILTSINHSLEKYFKKLVNEPNDELAKLAAFGTLRKSSSVSYKQINDIFVKGQEDYNKAAKQYQALFTTNMMKDYSDSDPKTFKTDLRNKCQIVKGAFHAKDKRLQDWQERFSGTKPIDLLDIISNTVDFPEEYLGQITREQYNLWDAFAKFKDYQILSIEADYIVPGVIGAGIKTTILYYLKPEFFNRSIKSTLYAMYFLTYSEHYKLPSRTNEFIMINDLNEGKKERGTTSNFLMDHNYWYPYDLFMFYSKTIYDKLVTFLEKNAKYKLNPAYRYVDLNTFMSFINAQHSEQIKSMTGEDQELNRF